MLGSFLARCMRSDRQYAAWIHDMRLSRFWSTASTALMFVYSMSNVHPTFRLMLSSQSCVVPFHAVLTAG